MVWSSLYNGDYGLINYVLSAWSASTGRTGSPTPPRRSYAIAVVGIWAPRLQPDHLPGRDAGDPEGATTRRPQIDGAGRIRQFFSITLPLLSPTIFFVTVIAVIGALQVFDLVYVMASGTARANPAFPTTPDDRLPVLRAGPSSSNDRGYAAAIAVVLLAPHHRDDRPSSSGSSRQWVHYGCRPRARIGAHARAASLILGPGHGRPVRLAGHDLAQDARASAIAVPPRPARRGRWDNYGRRVRAAALRPASSSTPCSMTAGRTAGQVLLCSMAAYAFARLRFPGRGLLFGVFLSVLMVPPQLFLIPQYEIMRGSGGSTPCGRSSSPACSAPSGPSCSGSSSSALPRELEEAARLDGADRCRSTGRSCCRWRGPDCSRSRSWSCCGRGTTCSGRWWSTPIPRR